MRLTIDGYCKQFKMSKEIVHSKLRAKRLNYVIENGVTYIITPNPNTTASSETFKVESPPVKKILQKPKVVVKPKTTVATIIALYQRENLQLKEKILQLESKIDKLIDDKEQMLRDEMEKIEQVYSAKDEQLKTILELVNTKLMMDHPQEVHEIQTIENTTPENETQNSEPIEFKSYIRTLDLKSYQRKIIKKRFLAVLGKDVRIIQKDGELYLDFAKYDYSDLLEY